MNGFLNTPGMTSFLHPRLVVIHLLTYPHCCALAMLTHHATFLAWLRRLFSDPRKGFLSVFTIHCSLQSASGRMFLHAREHDNPSNMRYMGLTVNKYVPDVKQAQSESWTGAPGSYCCYQYQCHK